MLANGRGCGFGFIWLGREQKLAGSSRLFYLSILAAAGLLLSQPAQSQESTTPAAAEILSPAITVAEAETPSAADLIAETEAPPPTNNSAVSGAPPSTNTLSAGGNSLATSAIMTPKPAPARRQVDSDISVMAMFPYGDYRLFAATIRCNAWTVGVEYDRNSWGHFMGSRVDYIVEVIPLLLLNQPANPTFWGGSFDPAQKIVPGISISPFGFRFLWRANKSVKPYVSTKLGIAAFTQKALSPNASYANFNIQAAFGLQIKMTENWDLRVESIPVLSCFERLPGGKQSRHGRARRKNRRHLPPDKSQSGQVDRRQNRFI